jgi:hypothetical protein
MVFAFFTSGYAADQARARQLQVKLSDTKRKILIKTIHEKSKA